MLASGLERSGQRNAGDPTFGPHPPVTNPPAADGAGGLFTHTLQCVLTLFSVPEGWRVEILLHYFPSLRDGQ